MPGFIPVIPGRLLLFRRRIAFYLFGSASVPGVVIRTDKKESCFLSPGCGVVVKLR